MRVYLIWGGGGHGKVVADLVRAAGHLVGGFVDADLRKAGLRVEPGGGRVMLEEADFLLRLDRGEALPDGYDAVALAIGASRRRLEYLEQLHAVSVPALVHPSAVLSPSVSLGRGTVVFPGALINADTKVGRGVIVNTGAIVEHDCEIGDGVHLSPRATIAGGVRVGRGSWIGTGATVVQGIRIGVDTVVGAGAAVIRDVEDGETVVGVPARPIRSSGGKR